MTMLKQMWHVGMQNIEKSSTWRAKLYEYEFHNKIYKVANKSTKIPRIVKIAKKSFLSTASKSFSNSKNFLTFGGPRTKSLLHWFLIIKKACKCNCLLYFRSVWTLSLGCSVGVAWMFEACCCFCCLSFEKISEEALRRHRGFPIY